jgi:hypothetical protein
MSETRTGLIGEMCAGAAILSQNWAYAQAPQDKFDGVAISNSSNEMLRVQVKASSFILQKGKRTPCYHFQLGSGSKNKKKPNNTKDWSDYDILALCGIAHRHCVFLHVSQINQFSKRLQGHHFTAENEADTWAAAVEIARETRR